MEADGQLLWKPRASHESHLVNFGRIAGGGGGGHDGDCLQELGDSCRVAAVGRANLFSWEGSTAR